MSEQTYWHRVRRSQLSRRTLLSASARAGVGAAGLALVGCGDDDDDSAAVADLPADQGDQAADQAVDQVVEQGRDQVGDQVADEVVAEEEDDDVGEQAVAQGTPGFTRGGQLRIAGPIDTWDYMDPHRAVFGPAQFNMSLYLIYLIRWEN